uniref:Uncharacterized protein n=1 Tax=viral metagenome TaxID=1070528 RepID=A0A6H1ZBJ5_9ZZZZ
MFKFLGYLVSIVDKLTPGRKEQLRNKLDHWEKILSHSLLYREDLQAAAARKELKKLRQRISDLS